MISWIIRRAWTEEVLILMRYSNRWMPLLFVGSLMSSCTCHQQVEEVAKAPTSMDHPVGFSARPTTVVFPTVASMPTMPPTPAIEAVATPTTGLVAGLPSDFPSDVTLMKDAEIAGVRKMAGDAQNVLVMTQQDRQQVYEFYEKDLKDKGWNLEQTYQGKDQSFLGFRKGNTIINMTIATDPNDPSKRVVGIMYQEDKPPEFGDF
jgi:hypothetical protein